MSKRHQATRRRNYGRRQHELHERIDHTVGPMAWLDDADDTDDGFLAFRAGRAVFDRTADWARSRGLD